MNKMNRFLTVNLVVALIASFFIQPIASVMARPMSGTEDDFRSVVTVDESKYTSTEDDDLDEEGYRGLASGDGEGEGSGTTRKEMTKAEFDSRAEKEFQALDAQMKSRKALSPDADVKALDDLVLTFSKNCYSFNNQDVTAERVGSLNDENGTYDIVFKDASGRTLSDKEVNGESFEMKDVAYSDPEAIKANGNPLNCRLAAENIAAYGNRLETAANISAEKEIQTRQVATAKKPKTQQGKACVGCNLTDGMGVPDQKEEITNLKALLDQAEDPSCLDMATCPAKGGSGIAAALAAALDPSQVSCKRADGKTDIVSKLGNMEKVAKTAACAWEPIAGLFSGIFDPNKSIDDILKKGASGTANCVADFTTAVLKATWGNLKALFWDLPGLVVHGTGQLFGFGSTKKVEDASADKQHAVGKESPEEVAKYQKDGWDKVKSFVKGALEFYFGPVLAEVGCNQWDGVKFMSNCKEPWQGLSCANCDQMRALACSVPGVVMSQITTAWSLGKVFKNAGKAFKFVGLGKGQIASLEARAAAFPKAGKVAGKGLSEAEALAARRASEAKGMKALSTAEKARLAVYKAVTFIPKGIANKIGKLMKSKGMQKIVYYVKKGWGGVKGGAQWANRKLIIPLENTWVGHLTIKKVKWAGRRIGDYEYAIGNAFQGNMRLGNLYARRTAERALRTALVRETATEATKSATKLDEIVTKKQMEVANEVWARETTREKLQEINKLYAKEPKAAKAAWAQIQALDDLRKTGNVKYVVSPFEELNEISQLRVRLAEGKRIEQRLSQNETLIQGTTDIAEKVKLQKISGGLKGQLSEFNQAVGSDYLDSLVRTSTFSDPAAVSFMVDGQRELNGLLVKVDEKIPGEMAFRVISPEEKLQDALNTVRELNQEAVKISGKKAVKLEFVKDTFNGTLHIKYPPKYKLGVNPDFDEALAGLKAVLKKSDMVVTPHLEGGPYAVSFSYPAGNRAAFDAAKSRFMAQAESDGYLVRKKEGWVRAPAGSRENQYAGADGYRANKIQVEINEKDALTLRQVEARIAEEKLPAKKTANGDTNVELNVRPDCDKRVRFYGRGL